MMQGPMSASYNGDSNTIPVEHGESNTIPAEHKDGGAGVGSSSAISSKQPLAALQGIGVTKSIDFISSSAAAHAPVTVSAHISKASSSSTSLNLIGLSSLTRPNLFTARHDHPSATATGAPAALPEDFSLKKNNSSANISLNKNNINDSTAAGVRNAENIDCPDENTYDDTHVAGGKTNPFVRRNSFDKIGGSAGFRYKECLKNHAANMGGYAVDGCGEFMPSGQEGSLEALKCAACGCHRNFHRREVNGGSSIVAATSNSMSLLALPSSTSTSNSDYGEGDHSNHTNSTMAGGVAGGPFAGGHYGAGHMGTILTHPHHHHHHHQYMHGWMHAGKLISSAGAAGAGLHAVQYGGGQGQGGQHPYMSGAPGILGGHVPAGGLVGGHMMSTAGTPGKRFRTKFTMEQREKMFEFSEKVGWRIHKHDEAAVQQFCAEAGIKRHVLKIWMHNNKNTFGKRLLRFPEAFDPLPKSSA